MWKEFVIITMQLRSAPNAACVSIESVCYVHVRKAIILLLPTAPYFLKVWSAITGGKRVKQSWIMPLMVWFLHSFCVFTEEYIVFH